MGGEQRNAGVGWWELLGRMLGPEVAGTVARALFTTRTRIVALDCERCRQQAGTLPIVATDSKAEPLLFVEVADYFESHGSHGAMGVVLASSRGMLGAPSSEIIGRALHAMRASLGLAALDVPVQRMRPVVGRS